MALSVLEIVIYSILGAIIVGFLAYKIYRKIKPKKNDDED